MKKRLVVCGSIIIVLAVGFLVLWNSTSLLGGWAGEVIEPEGDPTRQVVYQLEFLPGNILIMDIIRPTEQYLNIVMKYQIIGGKVVLEGRLRSEFEYTMDNRELVVSESVDDFPPVGKYHRIILSRDWICLSGILIFASLVLLSAKKKR